MMKTRIELPGEMEVHEVKFDSQTKTIEITHRFPKDAPRATAALLTAVGNGGREVKSTLTVSTKDGKYQVAIVPVEQPFITEAQFDKPLPGTPSKPQVVK